MIYNCLTVLLFVTYFCNNAISSSIKKNVFLSILALNTDQVESLKMLTETVSKFFEASISVHFFRTMYLNMFTFLSVM